MPRRIRIGLQTEDAQRRAFEQTRAAFQEAGEVESLPERFEGVLIIEGERTYGDDARFIAPQALTHRELPIPILLPNEFGGHGTDRIAGQVDRLERVAAGEDRFEWRMGGRFDLQGENGREAARLVATGMLRWVSADVEIEELDFVEEGDCDIVEDPDTVEDLILPPEDCVLVMHLLSGRIMGATLVPFSAFPGAVVVPEGAELGEETGDGRPVPEEPEAAEEGEEDEPEPSTSARFPNGWTREEAEAHFFTAAAFADREDDRPPAGWFDDPGLDGPTPLTVTDEGRVYGHLATWGQCHTGVRDACLMAPRSESDYAYFHTGEVETREGERRRIGQLTIGTGHADPSLAHREAAAHYDGGPDATQWADVAVGEDEHGVWVAGAVRPDVDDRTIRRARANAISGDWRRIGGALELVAALSVPVPGFPIAASAGPVVPLGGTRLRERDGEPWALVAAGVIARGSGCSCGADEETAERIGRLEHRVDMLMNAAGDDILASLDRRMESQEA